MALNQYHLEACPSLRTNLEEDCSCDKEVAHYLVLAKLSFWLFVFEIVGGFASGSMALISDALHVLLDGTENIISAIVSKLARKGSDEKLTRKIGGIISGGLLMFAAGVIIFEGYGRVITPHKVEWYMTIIAAIGLGVNLLQKRLHNKALPEHHNLTHAWQDRHLLSDMGASIAVIIGGVIMLVTDKYYWIDGFLSIGIGMLVMVFAGSKLLGVNLHTHDHDHHESHTHTRK